MSAGPTNRQVALQCAVEVSRVARATLGPAAVIEIAEEFLAWLEAPAGQPAGRLELRDAERAQVTLDDLLAVLRECRGELRRARG